MPKGLKVCFDRILPRDLLTVPPAALRANETARAAFERRKLWPNGTTLRAAFLDGTPAQHELVRRFAPTWSKYGNIHFDFVNNANPHLRITFIEDDGAWSYIGR